MRIIIAGSREFCDYELLEKKCDSLLRNFDKIIIVCGGARGADSLGKLYAENRGYKVAMYPADWNTYGKSAGYIRNNKMAEVSDRLIAFWDGNSRGTKHMINTMRQLDKPSKIIMIEENL